MLFGRVNAQDGTDISCEARPTALSEPWIPGALICLEQVIHTPEMGDLAFTSLTVGDDGTLYAARPLSGQVVALRDTDGDFLPDSEQIIAENLTMPNGLTFADGALYVSGGAHVYRVEAGRLFTLVDDLPSGGGYWAGGIAVHAGRLYVATGAPCLDCEVTDPRRGAILSFSLDGDDEQLVVFGLRQPTDLAFVGDRLLVTDSALGAVFAVDDGQLVELFAFAPRSAPMGLSYYSSSGYEVLQDQLLIVLNGSTDTVDLHGYAIMAFDMQTQAMVSIMPAAHHSLSGNLIDHSSQFTLEEMNLRASGFFPNHPLDITMSPRGWLYISISGGRILALRPYIN